MTNTGALQGLRVLVADDHVSIRDVITQALTTHGALVTTVEEGGAAMAALYAGSFDVFVTDLHMPGIDGVGLIEVAGSIDATLPVLVVTGFAQGEKAEAAVRAGAVELIEKPFELLDLVRAVQEAVAARQTAMPAAARITWWLEAEGITRRKDRDALPQTVAALCASAWGELDTGIAGAVSEVLADVSTPLRIRASAESRTLTVWRVGETFPALVRSRPDTNESAAA